MKARPASCVVATWEVLSYTCQPCTQPTLNEAWNGGVVFPSAALHHQPFHWGPVGEFVLTCIQAPETR